MESGEEAHQYSGHGESEGDADNKEEEGGEYEFVPSSQDTGGQASFKELSSTGEKSSGEFYIPFSRGTFEDGFAELGSSQNIDLRMTESQDVCLLNTESFPTEEMNMCPSSSLQDSPVGSGAGDTAGTADSSANVIVQESSCESPDSAYTRTKESSESLPIVRESEQEESNLIPEKMITVSRQDSADAQVVGSGPELPVDLDDSCNSEDVTVVQRGSESWRRKRAQDSSDETPASGKKLRLASDEELKEGEPESVTVPEQQGEGDALELAVEESTDPRQIRTLEIVDPETGDHNPADGTHLTSTTYPSHTSSSRASSCTPRIGSPYFFCISVKAFNSVERDLKYSRDYVAFDSDVSTRNFSSIVNKMTHDLRQWMSDNNIPISPQSSLYLTTSSDDSLAYNADRSSSSSSGLSGLSHIGGPLARSSTVHGPSLDGHRISFDPRISLPIITDPQRRSDAACSFSSEFKKPGLPLHKRSSASSSSSGMDNPVPPARLPPRSSHGLPDHEDSHSRPLADEGMESSNDLFEDQPHRRKLLSTVKEKTPAAEGQSEEEQDSSRSLDAPPIIRGPGVRDIDPDASTTYSYVPDVPVYAKWKGEKFFYAGHIIGNKLSKDKYKVMFDDQSEADVLTRDVIMMELLPEGTSIFADATGREEYSGGYIILSHVDNVVGVKPPRNKGYVIRHQETRKELSVARGRVCVSREAAQPLLLSYGAPQGSISAVSLDNIVTTKRKAKVKQLRDSWVVTPPSGKRRGTPGSPRSVKRLTASEKGSPSSGRKSRKEASTPSATASTLVLDEEQPSAQSSNLQRKSDTSSNSFSIYESETSFKYTGRFGSFESSRSSSSGPLFKNVTFLITGSEISGSAGRRTDSPSRRTSPTRRSAVSEEDIPFNRETLRNIINTFGGQETDVISETMLMQASDAASNSKRPCIFLIAPDHNRTSKYLQSLAANIPCIRHTWVHDSCREDTLQPLSSYRLPRGVDILTLSVVPWDESLEGAAGSNIFESVTVAILTDDDTTFGEAWERILTLGGAIAKIVPIDSVHSTRLEKFKWLLFDDRQMPTFTLEQLRGRPSICERLIVPNFLIQCLLHARLFNPSDSEHFTGKRVS